MNKYEEEEKMFKRICIILIAGVAGGFILGINRLPSITQFAQAQTEDKEPAVKPIEVGNKICPVSGQEIKKEEVYQVEYEGKIYNLCCKMCLKDFKKDPQKYIEKLEKLEEEEKGEHHHEEGGDPEKT